jgi:hypothetical protein
VMLSSHDDVLSWLSCDRVDGSRTAGIAVNLYLRRSPTR